MKASLLLVAALIVLSIPQAKAEPLQTKTESLRCNANAWPSFSNLPCKNGANFANYAACTKRVHDLGWDSRTSWWYCSNLGLKS